MATDCKTASSPGTGRRESPSPRQFLVEDVRVCDKPIFLRRCSWSGPAFPWAKGNSAHFGRFALRNPFLKIQFLYVQNVNVQAPPALPKDFPWPP